MFFPFHNSREYEKTGDYRYAYQASIKDARGDVVIKVVARNKRDAESDANGVVRFLNTHRQLRDALRALTAHFNNESASENDIEVINIGRRALKAAGDCYEFER